MCSFNECGTVRVQCLKCKGFFDFCPISRHRDSVCPHCGQYFINFLIGRVRKFIKAVPWWYGKPIPGWVIVEWEYDESKRIHAIIPEFYLDVNIHLAREKGEDRTREEAIEFFEKHAKVHWGRNIKVVSNEDWQERRKHNLEEMLLSPDDVVLRIII